MAIEIEKKYRLPAERREAILFRLEGTGAKFVGREFEENTIYSNDTLRESKAIVRIRKTGERTVLTYKRRIENELDVKHQIEHETEVSDADAVESIIAELGLHPILVYEKYRDTWRLNATEIVLDELPFGLYMEIEGTLDDIKGAEVLLQIEDLETEHETYPRLTARLGEKNEGVTESRFSAI